MNKANSDLGKIDEDIMEALETVVQDILKKVDYYNEEKRISFQIGRTVVGSGAAITLPQIHSMEKVLYFLILFIIGFVKTGSSISIDTRLESQFIHIHIRDCKLTNNALRSMYTKKRRLPRIVSAMQNWLTDKNGYVEYLIDQKGNAQYKVYILTA